MTLKNPLLDLAAIAAFAFYAYVLSRMLIRREALVRDGWTKWSWEPASVYPGSYAYGLFMTLLMLVFCTFIPIADFNGWLR